MSYLIPIDYLKIIQDSNLQQIITANPRVQTGAEQAAQAEAISYLRQKYDVSAEFTDTYLWSQTEPFSAKNRVYLNAPAFNSGVYDVHELTLLNSKVYRSNQPTSGAFNPADWDLLGAQYDIFNALMPFPQFDLMKLYNKGDKVFWLGNIYTCLIQTPVLAHEDGIQYYQTNQLPYNNVFPNDAVQGALHWNFEENYLVPVGTDILNASVWVPTDNRDQQMVMYFTDITIYHLHARIAPRNIPEIRLDRYNNAISWLKMASKGDITPNLPLLQPKQGGRIRFGGQVRNINSY